MMASAGDSYIGSLISLISKYEIRYEGVLYQLNVQDSTIGLKNVRSFGTEGRKKDGPQVHPSDKVYEYILFRGSDIKDLQVKTLPPANTEEQIILNDPAIIQSQYASESLTSPPLASVGKDNLTESTQWKDTPALRNVGYSGTHSSYHSPVPMGSELSSVTPTTMYHEGYQKTLVNSLNPQNHTAVPPMPIISNPLSLKTSEIQTSMNLESASSSEFRTPVSSSVNLNFSPPFPPMQYPTPLNAPFSVSTEASQPSHSISFTANMPTMPTFHSPSFPPMQYPTPLNVPLSTSTEASQPSHHSISFTANMPTMPTFPLPPQNLAATQTQIGQKAVSNPNQVLSVQTASTETYLPSDSASLAANAPNMPSFPFSHQDLNTNETQVVHKAASDSIQPLPVQTRLSPTSSLLGQNMGPMLTPSSSLLRPENSPHSGSQILSSTQNLYASKNMGAPVQMPSNTSSQLPGHFTPAPLLPLPSTSHKFTEEFDFEAMNEKFKKDEVWDYLGKAKQVDMSDGGEVNAAGLRMEEKEGHGLATNSKSAYNKDDFFDSISCNSLGHGPRKVQNRFPEHSRQNSDAFGFQQRPNPGYGGYGPGRSYNYRGPHGWGRGYGHYGGRGRGGNNQF